VRIAAGLRCQRVQVILRARAEHKLGPTIGKSMGHIRSDAACGADEYVNGSAGVCHSKPIGCRWKRIMERANIAQIGLDRIDISVSDRFYERRRAGFMAPSEIGRSLRPSSVRHEPLTI